MPYRTRSRSRSFRGNRDKYSVERTRIVATTSAEPQNGLHQAGAVVVPPTTVQGMRKVKHLRVSLSPSLQSGENVSDIVWALVFVPEGYQPNLLDGTNQHSLYEPNQFVMAAGQVDPSAGPVRISSPISRNLNSGDQIVLIVGTTVPSVLTHGVVEYAVTLQ